MDVLLNCVMMLYDFLILFTDWLQYRGNTALQKVYSFFFVFCILFVE